MSYIQTLSGKKFDYLNSTADDVEIEDIATALSTSAASVVICRNFTALPSTRYCAASLSARVRL
jgi:serine kinase of HPr protein (carbohydrate metabolism regulator)